MLGAGLAASKPIAVWRSHFGIDIWTWGCNGYGRLGRSGVAGELCAVYQRSDGGEKVSITGVERGSRVGAVDVRFSASE